MDSPYFDPAYFESSYFDTEGIAPSAELELPIGGYGPPLLSRAPRRPELVDEDAEFVLLM